MKKRGLKAPKNVPTREEIARRMQRYHDEKMAEYGWYVHFVPNDDTTPFRVNIHTHGVTESWHHPDLQIVIPLPEKVAHSILINAVNLVKEGTRFHAGDKTDGLLESFPVGFAVAHETGRDVLRLILPDKEGRVARDMMADPYSRQYEGTRET